MNLDYFLLILPSLQFAVRQQGEKWEGDKSTLRMSVVSGNKKKQNNTTHHFSKYVKCGLKKVADLKICLFSH